MSQGKGPSDAGGVFQSPRTPGAAQVFSPPGARYHRVGRAVLQNNTRTGRRVRGRRLHAAPPATMLNWRCAISDNSTSFALPTCVLRTTSAVQAGSLAWAYDLEGNKFELWEPPAAQPDSSAQRTRTSRHAAGRATGKHSMHHQQEQTGAHPAPCGWSATCVRRFARHAQREQYRQC